MAKRIDKLTDAQREAMAGWADKWIETGLRTGAADKARFEAAAQRCYEAAGTKWPGRVVWVPSPMVMAIAGPVAAFVIEANRRGIDLRSPRGAVGGAVRGAVDGAVGDAVRDAVGDAVDGAVDGAVGDAVDGAVRGAVDGAVGDAVDDAIIRQAVANVISQTWYRYIGGQFWAGGYYWGGAYTSFFREVCGLELEGDLWGRGKAYEATIESACMWWPHRDFVMVCERPTVINRELSDPNRARGWGSHRMHAESAPAIAWPDGWSLYFHHGMQMPTELAEDHSKITVERIDAERNAEVRRVLIGWYGLARYVQDSGSIVVHADQDQYGRDRRLLRRELADDEPIVVVEVTNSTAEPDGSFRKYHLRVDPNAYDGRAGRECHAAIASTWRTKSDTSKFGFKRPEDYRPEVET